MKILFHFVLLISIFIFSTFLSSCSTAVKSSRPELINDSKVETKNKTSTTDAKSGKNKNSKNKNINSSNAYGAANSGQVSATNIALVSSGNTSSGSAFQWAQEEQKLQLFEKSSRFFDALTVSSLLSTNHPDANKQEFYKQKSFEYISDKISNEELHQVSRNSDFGYLRGYALFKLGQNSLETSLDDSKKYFQSVIELLPGSEIADKSTRYLNDFESSKRVSPQTVGVVLPLSGKNASVGQRVLRGIQLGLGTSQVYSKFKIAVVDSEGRTETARRAVEKLVKEDNVIAIIGGLLTKTAASELSMAAEYNVPYIYLSTKPNLNEISPLSIRNSLTAEMQVRQLVMTSMRDLKMKNFAVIYPNDSYGIEYANAFWDEVMAQGGNIVAAQTYDPKETDFRPNVQRLVGTYYIEARKEEYFKKLKEFKLNLKNKNSRENVNTDDILSPIQNFDAVFIPDQAKSVAQVSAFLKYAGLKDVTILGTNLLNTPGVSKKLSTNQFPVIFVDSFIADGPNQTNSEFSSSYFSVFNERPSQIEIQAYDSGLLLRQLILQGASSREELGKNLLQVRQFPGGYGKLNSLSSKEILRPMIPLTFVKSEISPFKLTE